ncbi:hypothetical protein XFF6166_670002 [Xanthomonas citri pv. fuscans]|nr:hypothetical protein XFF6166_670002 [Xanthomonas citri pv. fuscans]SOO01632.1 hypothetical protein XFF6960_520002 [Xanthomonas citri pv. fuscans]SOO04353.1 hypothetical protein XFF7767_240194 [Xanthomonas citri pv. fuscans]SOO09626.1 hypothetical protein XFF6970_430035 [Xanthomonas citri pv. fuscans]
MTMTCRVWRLSPRHRISNELTVSDAWMTASARHVVADVPAPRSGAAGNVPLNGRCGCEEHRNG